MDYEIWYSQAWKKWYVDDNRKGTTVFVCEYEGDAKAWVKEHSNQ